MGLKQNLITQIENTVFMDFLLKNGREVSKQVVNFDVIIPESIEQSMICSITVWGSISYKHISVSASELKEMTVQIEHVVKRALERYKQDEILERKANKFLDVVKDFLAPEKLYLFTQKDSQIKEI